ncbi:protocatechuate 3,4-dioxygenase [Pusillimonas caeni]|uniref:DODA-type extradiol aromatic ring-opening family dioxygenase n=1 Tax=Pusillimonas caeni TaxID=1348472 RepID=UPI000E59F67D|nr:protocatechuate 3,4-dioxygenase [Pusillimonas caeni]TFL15408.1 protocatechuate 3,4-dioxygenase [Pusillimonas caeni]
MGKIVGGFLVPHDPMMFLAPEAPPEEVRGRMWAAFEQCADRLAKLDATAVVIVGGDHYFNFGTDCLPQYLIGTGDVDGPLDVMPGLKRRAIPDSQDLASFMARHGHDNGFDWSVARAFTVDHAVAIPDRLIVDPVRTRGKTIGTIPVYVASGVDPYISMSRCAALGGAIRAAVEAADDHERVVLIGSGGLSHWIGLPQMGQVNEAFDREILSYACSGDLGAMTRLSDEYILSHGGNGGMEIRHWAVAMGAMPGAHGYLIDYAPVPEWVTGLGFVQLIQ